MGRLLSVLSVLCILLVSIPSRAESDVAGASSVAPVPSGVPNKPILSEIPDEIIVRLRPVVRDASVRSHAPDAARRERAIRAFGLAHDLQLIRDYTRLDVLRFRLSPGRTVRDALRSLGGDSRVLIAQPNYVYAASSYPSDPQLIPQQWGVFSTFLPSLWRPGNGANGKVIAFLDSGVESGHSDLTGGLWTNGGEVAGNNIDDDGNGYIDDLHGWNFVSGNATIADNNGHGTHVTGVACARANNGVGIAGVAHKATYLPLKILNQFGTGVSSDIAAALEYAATKHPDVVNMSFNVAATPLEPDADCIVREQIATALAAGCVLVGAAGNSGGSLVELPAAFPGVISVGATNKFGGVWSHSSHGDGLDVVAPGVDIYSTWLGNTFMPDSGTSVAAPFISGVCALLLEKFPGTKPWEMERYVRTLTRDLDGKLPGVSGNHDGYGLISFGTLSDYSNGVLPPAWSLDDFFEFLGSDWSGESSVTDDDAVGANDGDDKMPDLDGKPNSSGHDAFDDGLFNASAPNLPLLHAHLYPGAPPQLNVKVGVGDFNGNRWDGGVPIGVRSWVDWNTDNQLTDATERIFGTTSTPRTWGGNSTTLGVDWTPSDEHPRGNPLRIRTRLFGPGTTQARPDSMQEFGEVEDQAVLNFVEDFDVPIPHPTAYADFGSGWSIVPDDPANDCYFLPPGPPENRSVYDMAFVHRTTPCPVPETGTLLLPELAAPALDLRELTKCFVRLWYAHSVAAHCSEAWHDDCRVVLKLFDANMTPLPDVVLFEFPEPYCPDSGYTKGEMPVKDISAYVGGFARLAIVHDITDVYDALAIDDVRIYGWDDELPRGTTIDAASMTKARTATITWKHPIENTAIAPSDPVIELYGARLWTGADDWDSAYRLTPRDFALGVSSFPKAGPPLVQVTDSLRVPSVFPNYQIGLRAQDEETLEGSDVPKAFSTAATFAPVVLALDTLVAANPGQTVKVAFMLSSAGNALDAIMADAIDTRSWLFCPHRWAEVFDPGGAAVESLEIVVSISAVPADTDTVLVTATSLSGGGLVAAMARVVVNPAPPDTTDGLLCGGLWVTDAAVTAIAYSEGKIYIGGSFTRVAPATGNALPLDAATGLPLGLPKVAGEVHAIAPDGSGGWYIGGPFTHVGGVPRSHLAHIRPDHTLSPWNPNANERVEALAVSGSTVYAGGSFTSIGGEARNRLAALDATTGLATAWDPNASSSNMDATVFSLAVSGSTVYVGGDFDYIGLEQRLGIAALDATTGIPTAWDPQATYSSPVNAIVVNGGTVYAGGGFASIGGQARNFIAALDAVTGSATAWNPGANNAVAALAVRGSTVYAGGYFTSIGGQTRRYVAALDATTGNASAWNPDPNSLVTALAVSGSTVYAGGYFTTIGSQNRKYLAALDAVNGSASAWNPDPNGMVYALAVNGSTVYAGGFFSSVGGLTRRYIAALNAATGSPTAWNPDANSGVNTLLVSGGKVYAGGSFTSIGGQVRNRIAALDATTGSATAWNPNANNVVQALTVSGGTVYAGGRFTSIGGQGRNRIAALDATTGSATAWNPNANEWVYALGVNGGTVYAGGDFTSIGGQNRNHIAALDAITGSATAWDPNANDWVQALVVSGGTVYVGGAFTSVGGQVRNRIAALDAATGVATTWDPNAGPNWVWSLAVSGGTVYAGGWFTNIGGQPRGSIAALDAATGSAIAWNPDANRTQHGVPSNVYALTVGGGRIYAGGGFDVIDGQPQSYFACLVPLEPIVDVPSPRPVDAVTFAGLAPNPASEAARLEYSLPQAAHVRIDAFDVQGRIVARLVDEPKPAGRYTLTWSNPRPRPGIYFVRFQIGSQTATRRLVWIR